MAGGGGAWKVAYADFVTAMMAFFMVMWLTSQKPEIKEAVAEYFKNPSGRKLTGNPNSSLLPSRSESSGARRSRTRGQETPAPENKMNDEGKRTNVGTIIKFDANTTALSEEARKKLDDMLPELQGKPHRIEVRGHAISDSQQAGNVSLDALNISFVRSLETMQYLVSAGIEPNRIRLSQAGSSEPRMTSEGVDPGDNARVEVYLLGETYEAPSDMVQRMVSTKAEIAAADKATESIEVESLVRGSKPTEDHTDTDNHGKKAEHGKKEKAH
jgi:chemotaxis protein MotB